MSDTIVDIKIRKQYPLVIRKKTQLLIHIELCTVSLGLAIMMVRTETPLALMDKVFGNNRLNIPKAPGLGLLLDQVRIFPC